MSLEVPYYKQLSVSSVFDPILGLVFLEEIVPVQVEDTRREQERWPRVGVPGPTLGSSQQPANCSYGVLCFWPPRAPALSAHTHIQTHTNPQNLKNSNNSFLKRKARMEALCASVRTRRGFQQITMTTRSVARQTCLEYEVKGKCLLHSLIST